MKSENKNGAISMKSILNSKTFSSLMNEENIFNEKYYQKFNRSIATAAQKTNTETQNVRNEFIIEMEAKKEEFSKENEEAEFFCTILNILLYPLTQKNHLELKSYEDANINIKFFEDIKNFNFEKIENGKMNYTIEVDEFTYNNSKLEEFKLINQYTGIKYKYNKDYKLLEIIFPDESVLQIPKFN